MLSSHTHYSVAFPVQTPTALGHLVPVLMGADTSVRPVTWASLMVAVALLLETQAFPGI